MMTGTTFLGPTYPTIPHMQRFYVTAKASGVRRSPRPEDADLEHPDSANPLDSRLSRQMNKHRHVGIPLEIVRRLIAADHSYFRNDQNPTGTGIWQLQAERHKFVFKAAVNSRMQIGSTRPGMKITVHQARWSTYAQEPKQWSRQGVSMAGASF